MLSAMGVILLLLVLSLSLIGSYIGRRFGVNRIDTRELRNDKSSMS